MRSIACTVLAALLAASGTAAQTVTADEETAGSEAADALDASLKLTATAVALGIECTSAGVGPESVKAPILASYLAPGASDAEAARLSALWDRGYQAGLDSGCDDYERRIAELEAEVERLTGEPSGAGEDP